MPKSNRLIRLLEAGAVRTFLVLIRLRRNSGPGKVPGKPSRVLLCKSCCLGDALLSLYAIREFHRQNPGVTIDVLGSARVEAVYRRSPDINEVYSLPVTGRNLISEILRPGFWTSLFATMRHLRHRRYDILFDLELYRGYGAFLPLFLGIKDSRGFLVEGTYPKGHTQSVSRPRNMPEWQCFYPLFGLPTPHEPPLPLFPPPPRLDMALLPEKKDRTRIGLVYGSSFNWPQKKWPITHFSKLISELGGDEFEFVLLGSEGEKEEAAMLCGASEMPLIDLSGRLDFEKLLAAVAGCDLVVGNDTGTMHVAGALGIPALTLFGPTSPLKWRGLSARALFKGGLSCRPCYYLGQMPACPHRNCLKTLEPTQVASEVQAFRAELSQNPSHWAQEVELE